MTFLQCSNKPCVCGRGSGEAAWATMGPLGHHGCPVSSGRAGGEQQTPLTPSAPLPWLNTHSILITDKAIRRLQIQRSPGHKTTAAGEPPSTSANAFAACAGEASNPTARYLHKANSLNPASSPASPGLPPPRRNRISLMPFSAI